MLVRDMNSGRLVAVPDNRFGPARLGGHRIGYNVPQHPHGMTGLGYYGAAPPQVVYDGLGNPVGLPFLAPLLPILAAKGAALLPLIAGKASAALPSLAAKLASLLPGLASKAAARLPSGSDSAVQSQLAQLLPQLQALLQQGTAGTPQRIGAPMPFGMYAGMPLGFYAQTPPVTPAPSPGPEAMAPQPRNRRRQRRRRRRCNRQRNPQFRPRWRRSPPALPPGGAPAFAPPDEVVVPMRVQRANGETVVVPVRLRRRRRLRRRFIGFQPAVLQRPLVPGAGFTQGYPGQVGNVQGWSGFNGWRGY